ncbi:MAG: TetR/AcrR family transcriptional regulator C-terminal domain-containing protein [Thermoleophilia bacterium]
MDLADEKGLDALTMRLLGRRLGVEAASLYNHVAGKDDLLEGMSDLAMFEIDLPGDDVGWKEAMRRRAISARETFARHRWAAALYDSREPSSPSRLAFVDRALGALMRAGFTATAAAYALLVLDSYLYGFERQRPDVAAQGKGDSPETAREVLAAIPVGEYPFAASVAKEYAAHPFDAEDAFELGLGIILDGLERTLEP